MGNREDRMAEESTKTVVVGVKFFNGSWQIRKVKLYLDRNNSFYPIWPKIIRWPDCDFEFYRVSQNDRVMYQQIERVERDSDE